MFNLQYFLYSFLADFFLFYVDFQVSSSRLVQNVYLLMTVDTWLNQNMEKPTGSSMKMVCGRQCQFWPWQNLETSGRRKDFWSCLWRSTLIMVNGWWRLISIVGSTIPWQGSLDGLLGNSKLSTSLHSLISSSGWVWCDQLSLTPAALTLPQWWAVELWAKINPCFLKLLHSECFTIATKSNKTACLPCD